MRTIGAGVAYESVLEFSVMNQFSDFVNFFFFKRAVNILEIIRVCLQKPAPILRLRSAQTVQAAHAKTVMNFIKSIVTEHNY
jgi:hypothetical protein